MTAFEDWYDGLDWIGSIERGDPEFLAFVHNHQTACRVAFEAGRAAGPDTSPAVAERPVQCRACDARITLPVSSLGMASIRGLDGWTFTTETGWQCPRHHGGSSDA